MKEAPDWQITRTVHSSQATRSVVLPLSPGQVIDGRYELQRRVGKGGMGVVFEARHLELGRRVALKFVKFESNYREVSGRRLVREARLAAKLEHENVVATLDCGAGDNGHYLVQEFVSGETLGEILGRDGSFPVYRACDLVVQACRGLEHAHRAGVVHRDLKPDNLMLSKHADGRDMLKILDFGIASEIQRASEFEGDLTATGGPKGTAHYMAPEVASGHSKGDLLSDVYSLGVILFELLSAERPHEGDCYNSVIYNIANGKRRHLEHLRSDLPLALVDQVRRAMALEPGERHQSADGLLQALAPFLERSPPQIAVTTRGNTGRERVWRYASVCALGGLIAVCYWLGSMTSSNSSAAPVFQNTVGSVACEQPASSLLTAIPDLPAAIDESWMKVGEDVAPEVVSNDSSAVQRTSAFVKNQGRRDTTSQALLAPLSVTETSNLSSEMDSITGLDIRNPYQ